MASARNSVGMAIALVVMGFGLVLSIIVAVLFYVQYSTAIEQTEAAEKNLRRFVNVDLERNPAIRGMMAVTDAGGATVVGQLLNENQHMKQEIFASLDIELGDVIARDTVLTRRKEELNVRGPLINAIENLRESLEVVQKENTELEAALETAQEKATQTAQGRTAVDNQFTASLAQLRTQSEQTTQAFDQTRQDTDTRLASLQSQFEAARQQMQEQVSQRDSTITELESRIRQLQSRLEELSGRATEGVGVEAVLRPDGLIEVVNDDDRTLYINRGSDDRVQLGMTFEVFERDALIRLDDQGDLRGKATIEVFQLNPASARARVVRRSRDAVIQAGDVIANIVYDPEAVYRFFIHGEFDVDRDGEYSRSDRRRLETMVQRWGGAVSDELAYDVDYLVLGLRPRLPDPLSPDEINPVARRNYQQAMREYETYTDLEAEARRLSIPVLNQNRFMTLMGLYQQR